MAAPALHQECNVPRRSLLIAFFAVAAMAAAFFTWMWASGRGGAEEAVAVMREPRGPRPIDPVRFLQGHDDGVVAVAFSPDGARLLTASRDRSARLWDVASGSELRRFEGHWGGVHHVAFAPDGKRIVTAGEDGKVLVWDAGNGDLLAILRGHGTGGAFRAAILPDGSVLSVGYDAMVRRWDVETEAERGALHGHRGGIYAMDVSRDGTRAVTGSADGGIVLWDLTEGRSIWTTAWPMSAGGGAGGAILRDLALAPDGSRVYAAAWGTRPVQVFDGATGRHLRGFDSAGNVRGVALSPDGNSLAVASDEGTRVWEADGGEITASLRPDDKFMHDAAFSPDGRRLAVARGGYQAGAWVRAQDARVPIWELGSGKEGGAGGKG